MRVATLILLTASAACGADAQPLRPLSQRDHAEPHALAPNTTPSPLPPPHSPPTSEPVASEDDNTPRLTSIRYKTWIWPTPNAQGRYLGYMRVGQSVRLRSTEPVAGQSCRKGFYAIEPVGYVCHDRTVTLERDTAFIQANAHTLPEDGAFPYRFALSNGAPMYARVPKKREQRRIEGQYGKAGTYVGLPMFLSGHEHLATNDAIAPDDPMPPYLEHGRDAHGRRPLELLKRSIPHGSMLAFTRAFDVDGRTFLLSTDLTVVPADRVREFERSHFHGTELGKGVSLPLAWMRQRDRPQYRIENGAPVETGDSWLALSFVELTGAELEHGGSVYLEVRSEGDARYIAAADATVASDYGKYPFDVKVGQKWIIVSIMEGTLLAYDGLTPVYATLMSPGQGGVPRKGGNNVKDSTTPTGTYRITFKDRAATMSPEFGEDRNFWIADVPFTQYFNAPFAIHGAYWHGKFGELMSGGCVNVSLIDAEWLFEWTDPKVPDGWQGVIGLAAELGPSTAVVVRR